MQARVLVRQGKKVVATISGRTRSGRNTISWNGKMGKKRATAGAYKLSLNASASDGQKAGISVALKLTKRSINRSLDASPLGSGLRLA